MDKVVPFSTFSLLPNPRAKGSYVSLKGLGHDWWSLFTISFYPKLLYISSMKPSLNRTTIFILIAYGIELHAAFEERENKQKNFKF